LRWSATYPTFNDWLNAQSNINTPYVRRVFAYWNKHPDSTLKEARGHREESYRYTLGTNISDKNTKLSFTGFYFSNEPFTFQEEKTCYNLFGDFVKKCLKKRYPLKDYDLNDALTSWGGILREEEDARVNYTPNGFFEHEYKVEGNLEGAPDSGKNWRKTH
jgi:hypothetical protein